MHFLARELPPYSEPVSADRLRDSAVYFSVTYADAEMHLPTVETLVFIGRNLESSEKDRLFFQDIDSHRKGIRYNSRSISKHATFFVCSPEELGAVFEFEKALEELMRCYIRRRQEPV